MRSYTSTPPICLHGVDMRDFTFRTTDRKVCDVRLQATTAFNYTKIFTKICIVFDLTPIGSILRLHRRGEAADRPGILHIGL